MLDGPSVVKLSGNNLPYPIGPQTRREEDIFWVATAKAIEKENTI
jgi:hypothetical protein